MKQTKCESGERMVQLVDAETGMPEFSSTVFTTVHMRGRNLATGTIEQCLRALDVLFMFTAERDICLSARMASGLLLHPHEISDLVDVCRLHVADIRLNAGRESPKAVKPGTALRIYRESKRASKEVSGDWAGNRIRYMRDYLNFVLENQISRLRTSHPNHAALVAAKSDNFTMLTALIPPERGRTIINEREGLDAEAQALLWIVIEPDFPANPWTGKHVRARNALIVRWFVALGIRRGELGGVGVRDMKLRALEVDILRRADDEKDPRPDQPNAKTCDRTLPVSADLANRTEEYIKRYRSKYPAAKKHGFLFVANGGRPISLRAINRIFEVLKKRHSELGSDVFPHILRHTNNDIFSTLMDEKGVSEADEKKLRSRLMGWTPQSGTATTYTRRTINRRAKAASLDLQDTMPTKPSNAKRP
ncbi:MAG: tyrosine-type recombinase/integrase [Telluria sp.]